MGSQPLLRFDGALEAIGEHVRARAGVETVPLERALGRVLAEEIRSDDAYPRFDNSAVDGYAVRGDAVEGGRYRVTGTVGAGGLPSDGLEPDSAVRVFTGAPVPPGAFGVVMQEDVRALPDDRIELRAGVEAGENIRRRGSEIEPQELLLTPGADLNPGAIGLLALCGLADVKVRALPRIGVLSTGDELIDFRKPPVGSQIRDTSGPMLQGLFADWGLEQVMCRRVVDEPEVIKAELESLAGRSDLIVATGGVSVGGRDYLPSVLRELGDVIFHGVSMRPGKPVLFGRIGECFVFGLPGNPASSFVACHTFVREAVRLLSGAGKSPLRWVSARYGEDKKAYSRDDFVRVSLSWREDELWADPAFEQASFGLRSLAACDGIARLPADVAIHRGHRCRVLLI